MHAMEERRHPDVYVMSKFHQLPVDLKKYLPEDVNVIVLNIPGLELNKDKIVEIPDRTEQLLKGAEVIVTDSNCLAQLLYRLPNAKWVQNTWAGVETVIDGLDGSKPFPPFKLTRYVDSYFGDLMANYVIAHIINVERNFFNYHEKKKIGVWDRPRILPNFRVLRDLTVGVLGAGAIGSAVGNLLKKGGCRVIAFVRNIRNESSDSRNVTVTDLNEILNECDYICNVLPSTKNTRGLLDGDALKSCKKKPVFINIGRGDIIQNSTIMKALREGWISRAILDVFTNEPLPSYDPLWNIPEVHITPHIGAMPKCEGVAQFAAENYVNYVTGKPLMNVVNWENGY